MSFSLRASIPLCAMALAGALSAAPTIAAPTVVLTGLSSVVPGGSVQLEVRASGFTDLYAYQFDIGFDPALFQATAVAQGGFLGGSGSTFFDGGSIDNAAGTISFIFESLIGPGAGASGAGELAHLSFDALGPQYSSGLFTLTNFIAFDSALNAIDVDLQGFAVSIPEPSSLALALVAMGLFGATRRRNGAGGGVPAAA